MSHKRTALITGGSRGIGAAIARELARQGLEIRTPERAELDLSDPSSVTRFVESQEARMDVLVNNAGINFLKAIPDLDAATWGQMQQVNLAAPLSLIQWAAPFMRAQKWGRILNVSSVFSLVTKEKRCAYSMTKAALNALTRSAAVELGPDGILVNSLCPGYVETPMAQRVRQGYAAHYDTTEEAILERFEAKIPLGRYSTPEEVAALVAYLISDAAAPVTAQAINVCGGLGNY